MGWPCRAQLSWTADKFNQAHLRRVPRSKPLQFQDSRVTTSPCEIARTKDIEEFLQMFFGPYDHCGLSPSVQRPVLPVRETKQRDRCLKIRQRYTTTGVTKLTLAQVTMRSATRRSSFACVKRGACKVLSAGLLSLHHAWNTQHQSLLCKPSLIAQRDVPFEVTSILAA